MRDLQPALHDIGKLVDHEALQLGGHSFSDIDRLKALGGPIPATKTWDGIRQHHSRDLPQTPDLFLLNLADHAASSFRAYEPEVFREIAHKAPAHTTVHKLWNPSAATALVKLSTPEELRDLLAYLASDPDDDDFMTRYADKLRQHPEDQYAPLNVVSLGTHLWLVCKFFRFFKRHCVVESSTPGDLVLRFGSQVARQKVAVAETKWALRLVHGVVAFAQEPIRARDLNVFQLLAFVSQTLSAKEEVLFFTVDQFVAVLPVGKDEAENERNLHALLHPLLEAGLHVRVSEARLPLDAGSFKDPKPCIYRSALPDTFSKPAERELNRQLAEIPKRLGGIPDPIRRAEAIARERDLLWRRHRDSYPPRSSVYPALPATFGSAICEVCQMEEGVVEWPKQEVLDSVDWCAQCRPLLEAADWPPDGIELCDKCAPKIGKYLEGTVTRELLGRRCYELRRKGVRLTNLNNWTDQPRTRVVWLRAHVDLERLEWALRSLYTDYVRDKVPGLAAVPPDVRLSLIAEFLQDYRRFLADLNCALEDHFGADNVEQVFRQSGSDYLNDLWCVRIGYLRDVLCVLKLCQGLVHPDKLPFFLCSYRAHKDHATPHFPAFVGLAASPIRLFLSVSAARYPFLSHWRQMEYEREAGKDDVYVQIIGKGEMRIPLCALEPLLSKADTRSASRHALQNLAEIAEMSEDLAKMRMHYRDCERSDADAPTYERLKELLPLGLSYRTLVTLAKIIGG